MGILALDASSGTPRALSSGRIPAAIGLRSLRSFAARCRSYPELCTAASWSAVRVWGCSAFFSQLIEPFLAIDHFVEEAVFDDGGIVDLIVGIEFPYRCLAYDKTMALSA